MCYSPFPASAEKASAGDVDRAFEHGIEHRFGEPAGERVLLAGVEAAEQAYGPTDASAACPKVGRGRVR